MASKFRYNVTTTCPACFHVHLAFESSLFTRPACCPSLAKTNHASAPMKTRSVSTHLSTASTSRETAYTRRETAGDSKHTKGDRKYKIGDSKHTTGDSKYKTGHSIPSGFPFSASLNAPSRGTSMVTATCNGLPSLGLSKYC